MAGEVWLSARRSGYQPDMLLEQSCPGKLYKNDLVCCRSMTDELVDLIVCKQVLLGDNNVQIPVTKADGSAEIMISSSKLLNEKGQIMTVPSQLYEIIDGGGDVVSRSFEALTYAQDNALTDEEWVHFCFPKMRTMITLTTTKIAKTMSTKVQKREQRRAVKRRGERGK